MRPLRLLIAEDDQFKAQHVLEFLREVLPQSELIESRSVNSSMRLLEEKSFDLCVLDMSLPTFDVAPDESGGRAQGFGGREVLRFLDRMELHVPVLVVTQYKQFEDENESMDLNDLSNTLRAYYPKLFVGLVHYDAVQELWRRELRQLVKSLFQS